MLRTTAQQKALCRSCPLARAAHLLGDTCSLLIVRDTLEGPKRFSDLAESLSGVSSRTLTLKLQLLEREGFLIKNKTGRYALTAKGRALKPVISALRSYGSRHL